MKLLGYVYTWDTSLVALKEVHKIRTIYLYYIRGFTPIYIGIWEGMGTQESIKTSTRAQEERAARFVWCMGLM